MADKQPENLVPVSLAKVGDMTPECKVVFKMSIFDLLENGKQLFKPEAKLTKEMQEIFDVGSVEVKDFLHEFWHDYLVQVAEASAGVIAQEIPDPKRKMLSLLQTAYKEVRLQDMTPEEDVLLRAAFDAVKAMGFIGAVTLQPSITKHPFTGEQVGYHKLIRSRLRTEDDESAAQVDLSCIDPESLSAARSHAQIMQESHEAASIAMAAFEKALVSPEDQKLLKETINP